MKSKRIFWISLLLAMAAIGINAQSQDRDNPTPLAANTIQGSGNGQKVEYYFRFTAGPGEVVVTVDLTAKSGSTNADVEIFAADSKVFYYYPNATSTNEHAVKRFTISGQQLLTLRLALDGNAGAYSIKLSGAVVTESPANETNGTAPVTDPAAAPTDQQPATTPSDSAASGKTSKLKFGMNILQTVGSQFGLPTTGVLHLVMKDGTTQEIDLSKVKTASLSKQ